ncbi:uncharacterized protein LOC113383605 [Ctenocephalides felis]|uniref:uncharacterized protein LOC113383605 n=1 Tax=Ctenocephalides felis TaxID=7515 RepID=UPI000E6E5581|nr:uncharacterized protein LOC113383605 [Ctenocephalides felis]
MNPEAFAQIFKKCIVADQEIKILILETYSKLYMDDMISLTGIISLINLTINELLIHVFPIMFEEPNDLRVCALNLMSKLVPAFIKSNYRTHSEWINIKQHLTNRYSNTIKNLLINDSDLWHKSWILVVMLLSPEINKSSNIMNKLLSIIEVGLKTQTQIANTWDCWKVLITIYSESSGSGQGIQNPKYIKLLSCPFKRQLKYNTAFDRMFDTWIHLFANIPREQFDENCDLLVRPFIEFSFGVNTTDTLKVKELVPKIFFVFVQMVGHSCEGEKCLSHNSTANSVPHKINGYLASYKVFNTYWKEILQCSGDMIKNLMKLNPLEYKWSDIASCVWSRMLKLINMHFLNSEKISEVQEELLRILSLLVVMSQGNNQLASVCLQSLLTKTAEEFSQKLNFKENKYEFKFIDLITLPCMVSCLGNDSLVPVYKNLLLNFLSDVSSMKFACSKILNLIKNMTAENPVPNITYDLFCETVVDKISGAGNFFTNNIEDIAHILTQFIVFPFEHKNYLRMKDNTIENLNMLHAKCCSEKVDKVVAAKINAEIAVKLYSTNVKSPLDTCEKRHRKNLFVLCNNVILNIFATVLERIEYDAESISIFLKLCSQMIIFMKKSSNSVFGEFQFGSEDFEKSLITIERLCSILKSLNVITIVKCLQEFVAVFDNILEIREISELSKFNVSVTNTVDDLCKYYINNYQIKLNENKSFDKVLKSFIPIFKKFAIDDKNIKEISALIQSGDTPSTTPIRTPTIFGKSPGLINSRHSPNCGTPKSKKCLEDDFIVVPKTPVRKPQYTEKQKEKMKERSADIPSLYNELSQQSQDCSSITTNNTIFTQSCPEPENVSILELSTSEFEKSELDKNTSKTGSFFNNEFSDLESGIEHFDKCHESVISNNSVVKYLLIKVNWTT